MSATELAQTLAEVLEPHLGPVTITDLTRLSAGASRETWSFDAVPKSRGARRRNPHQLILQRDRAGVAGEAAVHEGTLLSYARQGGVPAPEVVLSAAAPNPLGGSFSITKRIDGETIARRILRDDDFAPARRALVGDFARALAAIHRLDPEPLRGLLPEPDDPVVALRDTLDTLTDRHPVFELTLRWLDDHRPAPRAHRVVHGDFRLGNLMVDRGGLVAVLDWELCHLGDPVEDLGWLCVRAWRFGQTQPVAGLGDRDLLLAAYRAESGVSVDPEELKWWEVHGTLKWAATTLVLGRRFQRGDPTVLEPGMIGRRVAETEYDLFLLLHPEAVAGPSASSDQTTGIGDRSPHDPPSASALLESVRAFLTDELADRVGGRDRFIARVAANAIGLAERELTLGPAHAARHRSRLEALGVEDDTALAAAIRNGSMDDRFREISFALGQATLDKLAVANPGYVESPTADEGAVSDR